MAAPHPTSHDPEQYWDAKARASTHDPLGAVCLGDPLRDRCIDNLQRSLIARALRRLDFSCNPTQPALLDMGCGTGRFAELFQAAGFRYRGIDIAAGMIEIAHREHPGATFAKFDGQSIPLPGAAVDAAVSMAVIHHNTYPRQEVLLDEMARVVRPGGALVLFEGIGRRAAGEAGVFFYRPPGDWREALERRGFVLEWQQGARYFALESLAETLCARLLRRGGDASAPPLLPHALSRLLLRAGAHADRWMTTQSPNRLHDRLFMLWRKPVA